MGESPRIPAQERARVVQLGHDDGASGLQRPVRVADAPVLAQPQLAVAAGRPHQSPLVPPAQREKDGVYTLFQQETEGGSSDRDVAEDEHLAHVHGRYSGDLLILFFDGQAALDVAQLSALGSDV